MKLTDVINKILAHPYLIYCYYLTSSLMCWTLIYWISELSSIKHDGNPGEFKRFTIHFNELKLDLEKPF